MTIDKEAYIKNGGTGCPYCGSDNLEGGQYLSDDNGICQMITCLNGHCQRSWYDSYTLTDIILDEAQEPAKESCNSCGEGCYPPDASGCCEKYWPDEED